jgi:hypothetical protein
MPQPETTYKIPNHYRPDGQWCQWTGSITSRVNDAGEIECPDRCQHRSRELFELLRELAAVPLNADPRVLDVLVGKARKLLER